MPSGAPSEGNDTSGPAPAPQPPAQPTAGRPGAAQIEAAQHDAAPQTTQSAGASTRAFAQATGIIFQTAGLILCFGSCCIGSFFGLIQTPNRKSASDPTPRTVVDAWRRFETHEKFAAVSVFVNCAAGLAVLAAGIGMQADKHGSARLGTVATSAAAAFHCFYVAYVVFRGPWRIWLLMPVVLAAAWTVLALLGLISWRVHRLHPPPKGPDRLPPGLRLPTTAGQRTLEESERKRPVN